MPPIPTGSGSAPAAGTRPADQAGFAWTGCSTCPRRASGARARSWTATSSRSWPRGYAPNTRGADRPAASSALGDVGLQLRVLGFQLVNAGLDDVADADDADQLPVFDHRHVSHRVLGPQRADGIDRVGLGAGGHHRRHDLRHRASQHARTVLVQLAHDITFGHDSFQAIWPDYHHGTDIVLG